MDTISRRVLKLLAGPQDIDLPEHGTAAALIAAQLVVKAMAGDVYAMTIIVGIVERADPVLAGLDDDDDQGDE
jgi:hypothetical protein